MRKPSKRIWVLTAILASVIAPAFIILTAIFPNGNERVTYSNYIRLKEQKEEKRMSVEDVEAILGPAARINVGPDRPGSTARNDVGPNRAEPWVTRHYVGRREGGRWT